MDDMGYVELELISEWQQKLLRGWVRVLLLNFLTPFVDRVLDSFTVEIHKLGEVNRSCMPKSCRTLNV